MTTHTPGPSMVDYYGKLVCGCRLVTDPDGIIYCPTHAAAPELLAILRDMVRTFDDHDATVNEVRDSHSYAVIEARTLLARIENGG